MEIGIEVINEFNNNIVERTDYLCLACKSNYKPIYDKLISYIPGLFINVI